MNKEEAAIQLDARQLSLTNFLENHVDDALSVGRSATLRSLIANYGRAEYGRGYNQGAKDER